MLIVVVGSFDTVWVPNILDGARGRLCTPTMLKT